MNPEQLNKLDVMIGETLAGVPTTRENQDTLMAIEGSEIIEIAEAVRYGWLTVDEGDMALKALHKRIYPS